MTNFEYAKAEFEKIGVNVDDTIKKLSQLEISLHCWQGDDVGGFENIQQLSGGIQVTGNYQGRARNPEELMADYSFVLKNLGCKKKINLHAIYGIGENIQRDKIDISHFMPWVAFAKAHNCGIDFNPTFFSHPMAKDGLTLSHPKKEVRDFWIRHAKCSRQIASDIAKELGTQVLCNIWIPDGLKDIPADRFSPRLRLKESLDEIFRQKLDPNLVVDAVESKVFGIGVESYTVGSHEFYMNYTADKDIYCLLDNGHFHPTENVGDKISSMLLFKDKLALHITRGVRWDSDHVVLLNDELKEIAQEIVNCNALDKTFIGLDYFDASINRISAWLTGARNVEKAFLIAFLQPNAEYKKLQDDMDYTQLMWTREQNKMMPYDIVYKEYLRLNNINEDVFSQIKEYEDRVLSKRN